MGCAPSLILRLACPWDIIICPTEESAAKATFAAATAISVGGNNAANNRVCEMALLPIPGHVRRSTPSQSQGCCRDGDTRTHQVVTAVLRSEMGAVASVVARLRAVPDKAKDYKWKEFKAYEGGVLVVRSNRLHKVAAHSRCTGLCATPHAWCKACDRGHWAAPQRALRCAEFRARTHIYSRARYVRLLRALSSS